MKPKLIHPIEFEVQNINTSSTTYDNDFDEPTGAVVYETVQKLQGQVRYYEMNRVDATAAGFEYRGDGYLLIYEEDASKIKLMAKISKIDGKTVEYYVREIAPAAHYESSNFRRVYFEAREKGTP